MKSLSSLIMLVNNRFCSRKSIVKFTALETTVI